MKDKKLSNKIRMVYVSYESYYQNGDLSTPKRFGHTCYQSKQFRIPDGMTPEEACRVISCLSDCIEKENHLHEGSLKSVKMTADILPNYGFEAVENSNCKDSHGTGLLIPFAKLGCFCEPVEEVTDLITYGGEERLFRRSEIKKRYFEWYTADVTKEDVEQIYEMLEFGKELSDKVF